MLTGDGDVDAVVRAMRAGAADYIQKPPSVGELKQRIERCFAELRLRRAARAIAEQSARQVDDMIAADPVSRRILDQIDRVAKTDTTVLVTGETGCGKEVVASRIHRLSARCRQLFQPLNCTAITAELMESELFGHVRGAFTGADRDRTGKFELADGGTLFLDEVGDSPASFQKKLLRVLETGCFQPVGSNRDITVDVRLVAATNRDLDAARRRGEFRDDLYHRLAVYRVHLPPLRERRGDILPLARAFLARFGRRDGHVVSGFTENAERHLQDHAWPGNIRELRNVIERAAINARGERITLGDLMVGGPGRDLVSLPHREAKAAAEHRFWVEYLSAQLDLSGGVVKEAARRSGMLPQQFSTLCTRHGVDRQDFADG
jgi:DNA-binding NtrC family response regulator